MQCCITQGVQFNSVPPFNMCQNWVHWLALPFSAWPWFSFLSSLILSFLTCKIEIIIIYLNYGAIVKTTDTKGKVHSIVNSHNKSLIRVGHNLVAKPQTLMLFLLIFFIPNNPQNIQINGKQVLTLSFKIVEVLKLKIEWINEVYCTIYLAQSIVTRISWTTKQKALDKGLAR